MFVVGVTGGIGSGKSTVTEFFADLGIEIIDADVIAKELVAPGSSALQKIIDYFGRDLLLPDGTLNRKQLRDIIFSKPQEKVWLESLLHPEVRKKILNEIKKSRSAYTIVSAPLLFETGLDQIVDRVLVVDLPEDRQILRTVARDETSSEKVEEIIRAQVERKLRLQQADDIIDNSGSIEETKEQVSKLHHIYLSLALN